MDAKAGPDDATLYVETGEDETGSQGPFYTVYSDEGGTRRWGYYCSNCESFVTVMDSMGRLKCPNCSNFKKPDEWDAAHE